MDLTYVHTFTPRLKYSRKFGKSLHGRHILVSIGYTRKPIASRKEAKRGNIYKVSTNEKVCLV